MISLHNDQRSRAGVGPLAANDKLMVAAQRHAEWMARNRRLSHYETEPRLRLLTDRAPTGRVGSGG